MEVLPLELQLKICEHASDMGDGFKVSLVSKTLNSEFQMKYLLDIYDCKYMHALQHVHTRHDEIIRFKASHKRCFFGLILNTHPYNIGFAHVHPDLLDNIKNFSVITSHTYKRKDIITKISALKHDLEIALFNLVKIIDLVARTLDNHVINNATICRTIYTYTV
jgi:hypothetical protein